MHSSLFSKYIFTRKREFFNFYFIVFLFSIGFHFHCKCENEVLKLSNDSHENYLFLATIEGNIHLLNRQSGELKWSTKLVPFIKTTSTNGSMLIPNPISGHLYIFHRNENNKDVFSPLEYSLYEYVKKTPLFMENLLLTGSKSDQWISINIDTGEIIHKYQTGNIENCPHHESNNKANRTMYIGICQYNLVVTEPNSRQLIYNVVLNSLATHAVTDIEEHDMRYYASSDSGLVVTKYKSNDIETGWSVVLDSSVIGLYSITEQGILSRLQFTSMSHETLSYVFLNNFPWSHNQISLKKAMFFGQSSNSWYILKTFIHQNNKVKSIVRRQYPLITGPMNITMKDQNDNSYDDSVIQGFYELPAEKYVTHQNRVVVTNYLLDFDRKRLDTAVISKEVRNNNLSQNSFYKHHESVYIQFISIFVAAIFIIVLYIAVYITKQKHDDKGFYSSKYKNGLMYDSINSKDYNEDEAIEIGDLKYYSKEVLGYGNNGTAVFRGVFLGNDQKVAVKRLLKSERSHYELQFLKQSFDCSHLIKCFYITESREFTFLALELCECTLEEYVSDCKFRENCRLDKITACKQMILGVHFLHDKGIVHRDLKPRNVLLLKQHRMKLHKKSPEINSNNSEIFQYKIVISDFGLSRQSVDYGISITKTGCGGTSGYMAPELSRDDVKRISINSDIFSCGILFYYILTNGLHPFGQEIMSRQHRIHQGKFDLNQNLLDQIWFYFIKSMLHPLPNERPSAEEILHGPLFWKSVEKLSFLCDISDFIEKNDLTLQMSLDKHSEEVFSDKWIDHMEIEFVDTLTTQRSYKTKLLSHLIRALRNKRNHFHELPSDLLKRLFDNNLIGFAAYIEKVFPNLYKTLYEWVRNHLDIFPNSFHHYFPSSLTSMKSSGDSCNLSDITNDNPPTEPENDENNNEFLEWRKKPKRVRPNKQKKIRGLKNDRKLIN